MRPLTFINGVILGSAGALGTVLGLILFFRWTMTSDPTLDQTVVQSDLPLGEILCDMCIFLGLTAVAFAGFWGELKRRPWRGRADYVLAVTVSGVCIFFFADAEARVRELALLLMAAAAGGVLLTLAARLGLLSYFSRWLGE